MSRTRKVWLFGLVAYGWAWFFWLPSALIAEGITMPSGLDGYFSWSFKLGGWGPLVAAIVVTFWDLRMDGVKDILKRGVKFRFGLIWYLIALLLFPIIIGGSLLLAVVTGESLPEMEAFAEPLAIPISFVVIFFIGGPLTEEFGWRGFAQDRLQAKWSALVASLVVGAMWGLWHLPLFFVPEMGFYYQRPIWGLVLSTILISIPLAWVYNNTGRSILAVMLMHTSFNWAHYLFPTLGSDRAGLILFVVQAAVAVIIVLVWGPSTLTRKSQTSDKQPSEGFAQLLFEVYRRYEEALYGLLSHIRDPGVPLIYGRGLLKAQIDPTWAALLLILSALAGILGMFLLVYDFPNGPMFFFCLSWLVLGYWTMNERGKASFADGLV